MRTISNFQNFYSFYSFITKQLHQYTVYRRVEKRWITLWVRVKYEGKNVEGGFGFYIFSFFFFFFQKGFFLVKIIHIKFELLNFTPWDEILENFILYFKNFSTPFFLYDVYLFSRILFSFVAKSCLRLFVYFVVEVTFFLFFFCIRHVCYFHILKIHYMEKLFHFFIFFFYPFSHICSIK